MRRVVRSRRRVVIIAGMVVIGVAIGMTAVQALRGAKTVAAEPVVIVAVGDISCQPTNPSFNAGEGTSNECRMKATSDIALKINPAAVLALGDLQYYEGALGDFQASYDHNWGRLKSITRPSPGNHEYYTPGAAGYYSYFGAAAGVPGVGYYSYDLGDWHIVALNSNCRDVAGCEVTSAQEQWLRADLAASNKTCTLAYMHQPRFSSGGHGNDAAYQPLWQALQDYQADVMLVGHDHDYERFAPQRADGVADPNGVTEFVVGTGGMNHDPFRTIRDNSLVRNEVDFGILKMTLGAGSYSWQFISDGGLVKDSGEAQCVTSMAGGTQQVRPTPTPRPTP